MQLFTGLEYLKIDIASSFGLDKAKWNERLDWFEAHEHELMEIRAQAKDPALYYAGVQAYLATRRGEPTGYPISLDATASGMQILAALTGDRSAAELCNVVPYREMLDQLSHEKLDFSNQAEVERRDGYTVIYNYMIAMSTGGTLVRDNHNGMKVMRKLADGTWEEIVPPIGRDETKQAIMTSLYGSKAVPKEIFGEGELYQIFLKTMEALAPGVWELNGAFIAIWDPEALENSWVLPDNFHVKVKVMESVTEPVHFIDQPFYVTRQVNMPTPEGRSLGANVTHSLDGMVVREMMRRCNYDPVWVRYLRSTLAGETEFFIEGRQAKKEAEELVETLWGHYQATGYLSARIINHLDSDTLKLVDQAVIQELLDSLPETPFAVLSTHDCFRCLPNYGNDLRRQYNRQLYEIARSELLTNLISQIIKQPLPVGKIDPNMHQDILETEYALS